jgi:hypothetical protein
MNAKLFSSFGTFFWLPVVMCYSIVQLSAFRSVCFCCLLAALYNKWGEFLQPLAQGSQNPFVKARLSRGLKAGDFLEFVGIAVLKENIRRKIRKFLIFSRHDSKSHCQFQCSCRNRD